MFTFFLLSRHVFKDMADRFRVVVVHFSTTTKGLVFKKGPLFLGHTMLAMPTTFTAFRAKQLPCLNW